MCACKLYFLIAFQFKLENRLFVHELIVLKRALRFSKTLYEQVSVKKVPDNSIYRETLSICINIIRTKIENNTQQLELTVKCNILQNEFAFKKLRNLALFSQTKSN